MGGKSSEKKAPEDVPAVPPLEVLAEGQLVFITSKASGKLLRIHEDKVDVSPTSLKCTYTRVLKFIGHKTRPTCRPLLSNLQIASRRLV